MKAVILAAGRGMRMRPLTDERPKPLVPVLGKPLLERIIGTFPEKITELIIVTGYKGDMIRAYCGSNFLGRPVTYVEQLELKGHIPALNLARPHLDPGESFFVVFADDLYDRESFSRLLRHPRAVLVSQSEHPERFGVVALDNDGIVRDIEEKPKQPKSNLVLTGAYVFDEHIFEYEPEVHENGEYYFPPVMAKMMKDYPIHAEQASLWLPIGFPEDIVKAEAVLRERGLANE